MTINEIDENLEQGKSLKAITQAYSEIANLKIKRIRSAVERNRIFFEEISKVYGFVRAFAIKKGVSVPKPKKTLHILITSNFRFYGNINSSLIKYFLGSTEQLQDTDKIIIGKGGIDFFKVTKFITNYQELLLKADMPSSDELLNLAKLTSSYSKVLVFYSKFKSLLVQRPTFADLTATSFYTRIHVKSLDKKTDKNELHFIFEPELPRILAFFEGQILTLLLEQTFLESELSRTASRFISMDEAETQANKFIKTFEKLEALTLRNLANNKILENYASQVAARKVDHGRG